MTKTYQEFLEDLAARESSGNYQIVNSYGYLGKYQMGEAALIDSGYYTKDGTSNNDWKGHWTGKNGVDSSISFLNNTEAQESAIREYMTLQWKYIEAYKLDEYVGKEINGIVITESGLLAGAHLKGANGLRQALDKGLDGEFTDAYGTDIQEYIEKFGEYETPFEIDLLSTEEEEEEGVVNEQTEDSEVLLENSEQETTETDQDEWGEEGLDGETEVIDTQMENNEDVAVQDDTSDASDIDSTDQSGSDVGSDAADNGDSDNSWDSDW